MQPIPDRIHDVQISMEKPLSLSHFVFIRLCITLIYVPVYRVDLYPDHLNVQFQCYILYSDRRAPLIGRDSFQNMKAFTFVSALKSIAPS